MLTIRALLVAGIALGPFSAHAENVAFPIFDPNTFCKAVGENNPQYPARLAEKACLANEQQAYDNSRQLWRLAADETRQKCTRAASLPGVRDHMAYEALENCLNLMIPQDQLRAQGPIRY
ncbi:MULTISPECIES: hypothetical protein [unclassified Rhizobium]|uniref:hypothetical protein n=1 Tax=unclassified Rhizobium TaxID=2613769 RepID=UPI0037F4328E